MKFVHGPVSLEIEDGWIDASQLAFMSPPDKSLADDLAKQAAAAGAPIQMEMPAKPKSRANFAVSFRPWFLSMDAKEFLEKELPAMLMQVPNAKTTELEWIEIGDAPAAVQQLEFNMEGMPLRQFHVLAVMKDRLMHFCGTSGLGDYEKSRPIFLATVQSIELSDSK